jgi:hypothetical protein
MPLLPADESNLTFYFRAASLFQRSTFGAQLDRARVTLAGSAQSWAWVPDGGQGPCHVAAHHEPSHGYQVEHADLLRFSTLSRRMTLAARDAAIYDTLAAYYGDRGARWQAAAAGRCDDRGATVVPGYGPGAVAALFSMVPAGRTLLARERSGGPRGTAAPARSAALGQARRAVHQTTAALDAATATLTAAMLASHAARADGGAVPGSERAALHAARTAHAAATTAADAARRRLSLLERPWQAPRLDAADARPQGREGPLLADGRWSLADPAPVPRSTAVPAGGPGHLTDDELLEVVLVLEQVAPRPDRRQRIAAARDQAEALLVQAWEAWLRTGPPSGRGGRRAQPRASVAMDARYARGGAAQW